MKVPIFGSDFKSWATQLVQFLEIKEQNHAVQLPTYTVATVPVARADGMLIFVSDETGGAVPAYSASGGWKRITDGAIIS